MKRWADSRNWQAMLRSERGANLVLIALMMTVLLGFTGLAIDGSNLYYQQQRMQIAADAAALGGARLLAMEVEIATVDVEIRTLAVANGADSGPDGVEWNLTNSGVEWDLINNDRGVNVIAQRTIESYFAQIFGYNDFTVSARAEAQWEPIGETEGLFPLTLSCDCAEAGEMLYVNNDHGFTTGDDSTPDFSDPEYLDANPQTVMVELDDNFESAYEFTFVSLVGNTWTYQVREIEGRDLSHWLLNIPSCMEEITAYSPAGASIGTDGSTGYPGIKWDVNEDFSQGLFSFTLDDTYPVGVVDALAKAGNNFGTTPLKGPICDGSAPVQLDDTGTNIALCLPTIDFERDDANGTLVVGQKVVNEWAAWGVHVTTDNPGTHPAMIFGSGNPTGNDSHIGTPNQSFTGPGIGSGGAAGMPGANSVPQNNVLIISENGDSSNPDDNADGGSLTFTFDMPVRMDEVQVLGIRDDSSAGAVKLYETVDGSEPVVSQRMLGLGMNSTQAVPLDAVGVRRMEISLPKGGAISSVVFCRSQQEPRYRIGDLIWADTNGNGQYDEGEMGVEGVKLELFVAGQADRVAWTATDAQGHYSFANLPEGEYEVQVADENFAAEGFLADTLYSPGSAFDSATGLATVMLPAENGDNLDIDGGFMPAPGDEEPVGPDSGTVYLNDNKNSTYEFTLLEHNGAYWRYWVREVEGRDLSHWNLLIGNCVDPTSHVGSFTPTDGSLGRDGSTDTWGIKWDLNDNFSQGEFSFTLNDNYHPAVVQVLAKAGPTHASVEIIGPDCDRPVSETEPDPEPEPDPEDPPSTGDPAICSFGWLDWNGGISPNMELSKNIRDTLHSGIWEIDQVIPAGPAVSNSTLVNSALNDRVEDGDRLKIPLTQFDGEGYAVCGFAYVHLVDFELDDEEGSWIELLFLKDLVRGLTTDPDFPDYGARDVRVIR